VGHPIPAQSLDDYKRINAWYNRLPKLAERLRRSEQVRGKD
jgi:hypothetical protein